MLYASNLEFRINEYADKNTVFVCNTDSSFDRPELGDGHRDVVGDFVLEEGEDFADLNREDLFFLRMQKVAHKLNTKVHQLERELDDKEKEIRQLERGYYTPEEDEL